MVRVVRVVRGWLLLGGEGGEGNKGVVVVGW